MGAHAIQTRGGVKDTRLEAKAKDTKKSEAKDSLSEDRTSQGQGQECSRPRPRTQAQVLSKKKKTSSKNFFRRSPIHRRTPEFLIEGGLNHKSLEMTSSKFFQRGSFCGTNTL